jgi:hypothetical protein
MLGRAGQGLFIVCTGVALGVAIGGVPHRAHDAVTDVAVVGTAPPSPTSTGVTEPSPAVTSAPSTTAPPASRSPSSVRVLAVNGSDVPGAATRLGAKLKSAGYAVTPPVNYLKRQNATDVFWRPGYEADAAAVATAAGLDDSAVKPLPDPPPLPQAKSVDVVVVVGQAGAQKG